MPGAGGARPPLRLVRLYKEYPRARVNFTTHKIPSAPARSHVPRAGGALWERLEVEAGPGGALLWDGQGPAPAPAPSGAAEADAALPAAARLGDEPVASASLRDADAAAAGRRRRRLQGLGSAPGPAPDSAADGAEAQHGADLGAERLLLRRAAAPGDASPSDPALQPPPLRRWLQWWRARARVRTAPPAAQPGERPAAGGPGSGFGDAGGGARAAVAAMQAATAPPAWASLATTAVAVAPGVNVSVHVSLSGARWQTLHAPSQGPLAHAESTAGCAGRHRRGRGRRDDLSARAIIACGLGARSPPQHEPVHACVTCRVPDAGAGLARRVHEAVLVVRSNDPQRPVARVPIALAVA